MLGGDSTMFKGGGATHKRERVDARVRKRRTWRRGVTRADIFSSESWWGCRERTKPNPKRDREEPAEGRFDLPCSRMNVAESGTKPHMLSLWEATGIGMRGTGVNS
ncbi:hypothetical protein NDU88_000578 [Pleurodeles waltl]|uniref:Uncharacterized protein n=1 Tax=Pleurodeles waltl TaxID=8319 RepID=A0AAV7L7A3_PLEWA|nr:hypothetical protein NDU88_000578 [Pleurodeles waltl]